MLASRKITQWPSGFRRSTDIAGPSRFTAAPPDGCMVTTMCTQLYAQSPNTRTSCTSAVPSNRTAPSIARDADSNADLPRIGGRPGPRNTTSSAISSSTPAMSPFIERSIQFDTRTRMACSSEDIPHDAPDSTGQLPCLLNRILQRVRPTAERTLVRSPHVERPALERLERDALRSKMRDAGLAERQQRADGDRGCARA